MTDNDASASIKMTPTMCEIDYYSDLLQNHMFNYFDPSHKHKGFATPLLCAVVLGCVAGSLWISMKSRGAELTVLHESAYPKHIMSEHGYSVVDTVRIELDVSCPAQHVTVFEEEKKSILKHGCPAVGSVSKPISVDINIVRN
jgi:hypothetical protein